jgi:hypothetical protein
MWVVRTGASRVALACDVTPRDSSFESFTLRESVGVTLWGEARR